jgi:hypothetical protein
VPGSLRPCGQASAADPFTHPRPFQVRRIHSYTHPGSGSRLHSMPRRRAVHSRRPCATSCSDCMRAGRGEMPPALHTRMGPLHKNVEIEIASSGCAQLGMPWVPSTPISPDFSHLASHRSSARHINPSPSQQLTCCTQYAMFRTGLRWRFLLCTAHPVYLIRNLMSLRRCSAW